MKTKNPIRNYMNWYGREIQAISEEPVGRAFTHYGKFALKVVAINAAASIVVCGIGYLGKKIYEKVSEMRDQ